MPDDPLRPRKQPKQARSRFLFDTIVAAAGRVLPDGIESITAHDIAAAAGVSIGSLYQYFPGKEAIVAVLIERRAAADAERMRTVFAEMRERPLAELIARSVQESIDTHRRAPSLYRAMLPLVTRLRRHRYVRSLVAGLRAELVRELERREAELRVERPYEVPVFVATAAVETTLHATLDEHPELLDDPRFAEELTAMVSRYLLSDDGAAGG